MSIRPSTWDWKLIFFIAGASLVITACSLWAIQASGREALNCSFHLMDRAEVPPRTTISIIHDVNYMLLINEARRVNMYVP